MKRPIPPQLGLFDAPAEVVHVAPPEIPALEERVDHAREIPAEVVHHDLRGRPLGPVAARVLARLHAIARGERRRP
jgi:hypothetical protein